MSEIEKSFFHHRGDLSGHFTLPNSVTTALPDDNVGIITITAHTYDEMREALAVDSVTEGCARAPDKCPASISGSYGTTKSGTVSIHCPEALLNRNLQTERPVVDIKIIDVVKTFTGKSDNDYSGVKRLDQECHDHICAVGERAIALWADFIEQST